MIGSELSDVLAGRVPPESNRARIRALTTARESQCLALVLRPGVPLTEACIPPLLEVLDTFKSGGNLDLFLDHLGGACEETWRIVSMLRERFDRYTAIIPFAASPGATQIALGADHLLMGEASSLSPLDPPTVTRRGESGERMGDRQGDLNFPRAYIRFIEAKFGPQGPDSAAYTQLWSQLDPIEFGAAEWLAAAHREALRRCIETHLDPGTSAAQIERILNEVAGGQLGPSFPLTRRDCEERLGLSVLKPNQDLWNNVVDLHTYYEHHLGLEGDLQAGEQHFTVTYAGFIDSLDERRVLLQIRRTDERGHPLANKPALHRWITPIDGPDGEVRG